MSEEIPILLHNSNLFLNPELPDTTRNKINIDNRKKSLLKKKPSLGENNHLKSLRTSYLLPSLRTSTYLSKNVTSYLLTKQSLENKYSTAETEQNHKKSKVELIRNRATNRWNSKSSTMQEAATKKRNTELASPFVKKAKRSVLEQTTSKLNLVHSGTEIDNAIKKSFTTLSSPGKAQSFVINLGTSVVQKVRFYKPRDFLLVTTNLILLSVLAIVHRNGGTQRVPLNDAKTKLLQNHCSGSYTIPFESKRPTITTSYLKQSKALLVSGVPQYLHQNRLKYISSVLQHRAFTVPWQNEKQKHFVAVFRGDPDKNCCRTEFLHNLVPGWYSLKAYNTWNDKLVATRSTWSCKNGVFARQPSSDKVETNFTVSSDNKIQGIHYWMPFYTSQERIFTESDTMPSKRGTIYSKKVKRDQTFGKLEVNSVMPCKNFVVARQVSYTKPPFLQDIVASQFILKKCFYKYGLLLVSPSKRISEARTFKEADKDYLTRARHVNESRQSSDLKNSNTRANNLNFVLYKNAEILRASTSFANPEQSLNKVLRERKTSSLKSLTQTSRNLNRKYLNKGKNKIYSSNQSPEFKIKVGPNLVQALLPMISEKRIGQYSLILNKIENLSKAYKEQKNGNVHTALFPSGFAWSRFNLAKLSFARFVQVQDVVPTFGFISDCLLENTSVSGYKFPGLQEKEIAYLFKNRAFFAGAKLEQNPRVLLPEQSLNKTHGFCYRSKAVGAKLSEQSSLPEQGSGLTGTRFRPYRNPVPALPEFRSGLISNNKTIFQKVFNQLTTPFRAFRGDHLISQVLLTPFSIKENEIVVSQGLEGNTRPDLQDIDNFKTVDFSKSEVDSIEMQYTQVDLDEIKNIKDIFEKLGRNYEDYVRQPKDSLPALIISPSLEDDRDIEEEGIQIFRKRDFIKKKRVNSEDKNGEPSLEKTEFFSTMIPELTENKKKFGKTGLKNEVQNHQLLVKNALRQAQEEIDSIAKKEEKGAEKDKQVIPPLTRLEALYTIRNRERKYEQAKDLRSGKSFIPDRGSLAELSYRSKAGLHKVKNKSEAFVKVTHKQLQNQGGYSSFSDNKTEGFVSLLLKHSGGSEKKQVNHTALPVFENLFLYSDKPKKNVLNARWKPSASTESCNAQSGSIITPWVFSKLGDDNIRTDRKHSFFGEMSLPAKKLTAQEQKHIFQQKANPLLKIETKNSEFSPSCKNEVMQKRSFCNAQQSLNKTNGFYYRSEALSRAKTSFLHNLSPRSGISSTDKTSRLEPHHFEFNSVPQKLSLCKATVPLPLLSQFSVLIKVDHKKDSLPRFQVGAVNADLSSCGQTPLKKEISTKHITPSHVQVQVEDLHHFVRSKNRIYFYDNLSQNKACQSSTPKIKGTPLGSPVLHRVWQPKRMEPSTFRVSSRKKSTPVLPRISQKNWIKIMEWQLKKHFIEEDKRLFSLSLALKKNKQVKIKKVNLYLPWISVKKVADFSLLRTEGFAKTGLSNAGTAFCTSRWNSSSSTVPINNLAKALHLPRSGTAITFRWNSSSSTVPSKEKLDLRNKINFGSTSARYLKGNTLFVGCKGTNYWRLPTQQNSYTANLPLSCNVHGLQKPSCAKTPLYKNSVMQKRSFCNGTKHTERLVQIPKQNLGISDKISNKSILFESVTKYSWLFVYTFVFLLMFKQLFIFVYKVGLKDFFIKFLNSEFGRTITSEEFRYSIQNSPLTESYMPKKRLQGLFGLERNKVQLLEIVWFLRNHCQGRNGPRGILLVGPPGVESVSVVQAIAGEANLPIIVQSLEKIAQDNEPQRQLEQLYMRAHKQAPCVLFLDQLDTIGARRDQLFTDKIRGGTVMHSEAVHVADSHLNGSLFTSSGSNQNDQLSTFISNVPSEVGLLTSYSESNNTITSNPFQKNQRDSLIEDYNVSINDGVTKQSFVTPGNKLNVVLRLLTILDGITQSSGVVTVATARDLTKLDPALLRPKRFDRRIYLSLPTQQDRIRLFKIQTQSLGHIKEMPWDYLSLQTEKMSATDIRSAINYSLFRAVLKNSVHTLETLEYGIDCVKTLTDKRIEKK